MSQAILSDKKQSEQDDREPLLSIEDLDTRATETKMSDHEDRKTQPKQKKIILGMVVKQDTTIWNLIAMATFPALLAGITSFISALAPLVLQHKDYFAIDHE